MSAALPALAQLIRLDDKELLAYTCWALVYLSDGSNEKIQAVIEANVCARLIGLSMWVFRTLANQKNPES